MLSERLLAAAILSSEKQATMNCFSESITTCLKEP